MRKGVGQLIKKPAIALAITSALLPITSSAQSIEQAVAQALDSHPEIKQAFNRFKVREELVEQASSAFYPTIDFDAGMGREWTDSISTRRDGLISGDSEAELTRREIGITLQQVLFNGFQTTKDVERTEFEASAEQWILFSTAEDIALEVTRAYLEYMRAEQVVELSQRNLDSHQTIYDAVKTKTDSGLGSTADLSQVTGRLARAHSNLISAQNNLSDTEVTFKKLVNVLPGDVRIPVPDTDFIPLSLNEALERATANHPTLRAAQNDISAAGHKGTHQKATTTHK
nr:TolC family protein [Enterovibrio nigricans]